MTQLDLVEVFPDSAGEWRWHRKARNGEVVSQGEGYSTRSDALKGALRANPQGDTYSLRFPKADEETQ